LGWVTRRNWFLQVKVLSIIISDCNEQVPRQSLFLRGFFAKSRLRLGSGSGAAAARGRDKLLGFD
jgi:hypothetical protein